MNRIIRITTGGNSAAFRATIADLRRQGIPFLFPGTDVNWSSRRTIDFFSFDTTAAYLICRDRDIEMIKLIARGTVAIMK